MIKDQTGTECIDALMDSYRFVVIEYKMRKDILNGLNMCNGDK